MSTNIIEYFDENLSWSLSTTELSLQYTLLLLMSIGLVGTATILIATLYKSSYLSPHIMCILSLVFADFIITLTDTTAIITHLHLQTWHTPLVNATTGCMIQSVVLTFAVYAEYMSVALIAAERYCVICLNCYNHEKMTKIAIAFVWFLALLANVFWGVSPENFELNSSKLICNPNFGGSATIIKFLDWLGIVLFSVCGVVIVISYYCIFTYYRKRTFELAIDDFTPAGSKLSPMNDKERKLFVKLITITAVFLVCNTPLAIMLLLEFATGKLSPFWLGAVACISFGIYCAINPIILYYLDPLVRTQVRGFFNVQQNFESLENLRALIARPSPLLLHDTEEM